MPLFHPVVRKLERDGLLPPGSYRRSCWLEGGMVAGMLALLALALASCAAEAAHAGAIPSPAHQHQRELTRIARQEWGLSAPVALFAAQVHQESSWRATARSPHAEGLSQFTPSTAAWLARIYPDLGEPAPFSPTWSLRAMVRYDAWLYTRARGHTDCDRWWATLRWYNGGESRWRSEATLAVDPLSRESVDAQCGKGSRSVQHCPENLRYPHRILQELEPIYLASGWPGVRTCP